MKGHVRSVLPPATRCALLAGLGLLALGSTAHAQTQTMQQLLSAYADERFGMFIHFGMDTYLAISQPGAWAENRVDPKTFAPPNVDCHTFTDQWAAAAKSAGMKFGLLTTKHHDGFAIWPSKAVPPSSTPSVYNGAPYTIAQSAVPTMDVVRCYVDSFRAAGLGPALYFSIWDPNNGIGSQAGHNTKPGPIAWSVVKDYVVTQITELLSNYGEIPLFAFDGYSWLTGHQEIPYQEIHALVRQLQPNALILDHNGGVPWEVDTEYFEEPLGITVPVGNTTVGSQGQTVATDGQWFWSPSAYLTAPQIAVELSRTEPNYADFILDCPPNFSGVLDTAVVAALAQVPSFWTPNASRPPLPLQPPKIETPLTAVSATATSGAAALAIDGYNDWSGGPFKETLWTSSGPLPQSITIDLGQSYDGIDMLEYLPQRWTGTTNGNVTAYTILVSTDGANFAKVATGTWPADAHLDGLLSPQRAQFGAQSARFVRLEVDAVAGGGPQAVVGEVAVGSSEKAVPRDAGVDGASGLSVMDAGAEAGATQSSEAGPSSDSGSGDAGSREIADSGGAVSKDPLDASSRDAGGVPDGGSTGGEVPGAKATSGGCSCRIGADRRSPWLPLAMACLCGLVWRRRVARRPTSHSVRLVNAIP